MGSRASIMHSSIIVTASEEFHLALKIVFDYTAIIAK